MQIYFVCFLTNLSPITKGIYWNCMQTYRLDHLGSLHIVRGIWGYVIIVNTLSLALALSMYMYISAVFDHQGLHSTPLHGIGIGVCLLQVSTYILLGMTPHDQGFYL